MNLPNKSSPQSEAAKSYSPGKTDLSFFHSLGPGTRILATNMSGTKWLGTVDETGHDQGVLWMHTDQGERKMIDTFEYAITPLELVRR